MDRLMNRKDGGMSADNGLRSHFWKEERQAGRYGWLCVQEWSNEYRYCAPFNVWIEKRLWR